MYLILLCFLSILPGVLISIFIIWQDRNDPEPLFNLFICFILGMLSAFPAMLLEYAGTHYILPLIHQHAWQILATIVLSFVVVGFSEEFIKFFFVRQIVFKTKAYSEPLDGIVYAMMIGMGFATFENLLYIVFRGGTVKLAILRMFTAVPAHGMYALMMGYFLGVASFEIDYNKRKRLWRYALALPVFAHGLYDFFLFQRISIYLHLGALVVLLFGVRFGLDLLLRLLHDSSIRRLRLLNNPRNQIIIIPIQQQLNTKPEPSPQIEERKEEDD